jgi:hypothetical protein
VRYEATADPIAVMDCHCRDCQYASGGSHTTAVVVPASVFRLTEERRTRDSGKTVARHFCAVCGSPLFSEPPGEFGLVVIKAASLDDPSWLSVQGALYASSAQPWAPIDRSKPVFDKMPPRP